MPFLSPTFNLKLNISQSGDLSFSKGDVITITKKSDSSDDWCAFDCLVIYRNLSQPLKIIRWTGELRGREGIFPANFVEVV
jgi:hypothetical protein